MGTPMGIIPGMFSTIIPRNSVIPVSRSNVYSTMMDNQEVVEVEVYQGENAIARENVPLGSFRVEGIPPRPAGSVQIEVHFDFDHNGILTVTATEKGKGQQSSLVVNDAATTRLSSHELTQSRADIESLFEFSGDIDAEEVGLSQDDLIEEAYGLLETLDPEPAAKLREVLTQVEAAIAADEAGKTSALLEKLEDLLELVGAEQE
jgi:molecular chaperone DnaK